MSPVERSTVYSILNYICLRQQSYTFSCGGGVGSPIELNGAFSEYQCVGLCCEITGSHSVLQVCGQTL